VGDIKSIFGSTVKSKRTALGISQEELADRAGLHRTYISDVERGTRNPSLESIGKLAAALELSVSRLLDRASSDELFALRQVEILLVEDNPEDVEMTRRAFRRARIANPVRVVGDGAAALDFLFGARRDAARSEGLLPGVILLDLQLPEIGGLEVLRRIKADKRTQDIPVIILTVSDLDRDVASCRHLGATSYIVKPVGIRSFCNVTALLEMDWILVKPSVGSGSKTGW
jgi:CheY-like chemotaxis protein